MSPTGGRKATGARAQVSADWRQAMQDAGLRTDRPGRAPAPEQLAAEFDGKSDADIKDAIRILRAELQRRQQARASARYLKAKP